MVCHLCGCDEHHACMDPVLGACAWADEFLCTHCELRALLFGPWKFKAPEPYERSLSYAGGIALV